jgi:uncharacterized protein
MRRVFYLLIILTVVACQRYDETTGHRQKTMMIKASGELEALPDMASFMIRLECLDKSIQTSKECLVKKSNELNKKLLDFGVAQEDILTASIDMMKSYNWGKNGRIFNGYSSSTTVYITVKNMDKLDEIYTELIENQNLEIGGLSYSHSRFDSLKNEAYLNALKNANVLADKLTAEFPDSEKEILKLGNVEISSTMPSSPAMRYEVAEQMSAGNADGRGSINISRGTVKVNAILYVEYGIK